MSAAKDALYGNRNRRPPRPPFKGGPVPEELKQTPRWVAWRYAWKAKDEKWTKVPRDANRGCHENASSTDPSTWAAFDLTVNAANDAECVLRGGKFGTVDGIGFVFNGDGIFGLDIDACRDPATGAIDPTAREIIDALATYTEISPSKLGVKIFGRGTLPPGEWRNKVCLPNGVDLELYTQGRYFTVTGDAMPDLPRKVVDCTAALATIVEKFFPRKKPKKRAEAERQQSPAEPSNLADSNVIDLIRRKPKHASLWGGDTSGHGGDDSAADLALCNLLAFYAGPDPARIDALFRQSGLYREKWERADYSSATIGKALEGRTEYYTPKRPPQPAAALTKPAGEGTAKPKNTTDTINSWLFEHHQPLFRRKDSIVCASGEEVKRTAGVVAMNSVIIARLALADDAPRRNNGREVNTDALPSHFKKWCPVAWGDMLRKLPEEDEAIITSDGAVAETFRQMVRDALLSLITIGDIINSEATKKSMQTTTQTERRSVVGWCKRFAKEGMWKSIRDYAVWCKRKEIEGELVLCIAVRHELFSQIRADRRLVEMNANKWGARAKRYGVGETNHGERPNAKQAVVLYQSFLDTLTDGVDEDDVFCSDKSGPDDESEPNKDSDALRPPHLSVVG